MERLEQEHGSSVVTTSPTVPYKVDLGGNNVTVLESAAEYPAHTKVRKSSAARTALAAVGPRRHFVGCKHGAVALLNQKILLVVG